MFAEETVADGIVDVELERNNTHTSTQVHKRTAQQTLHIRIASRDNAVVCACVGTQPRAQMCVHACVYVCGHGCGRSIVDLREGEKSSIGFG